MTPSRSRSTTQYFNKPDWSSRLPNGHIGGPYPQAVQIVAMAGGSSSWPTGKDEAYRLLSAQGA